MSDYRSELHPHSEQLDRWRAGLLDPAAERALREHLDRCDDCQHHFAVIRAVTQKLNVADEALARELRLRRRQALQQADGAAARRPRYWSLAASVSALALGVALYLGWSQFQTPDVPDRDVYADVDFYLWLSQQDGEGNADNPS